VQLPPNHQRAVIQGLWESADAALRGIPFPLIVDIRYRPHGGSDAEKRAEIDRIAAMLGVEPEYSAGGERYSVTRRFSAVRYSALVVAAQPTTQHDALMRYDPSVDHVTGRGSVIE
jgi:hypothetical protein